jgi:hypothetical protein
MEVTDCRQQWGFFCGEDWMVTTKVKTDDDHGEAW